MNKVISTLVIAMLAACLVGCGDRGNERFVTVQSSWQWNIVVDKETGVTYIANSRIFAPLIDKDGNPMIWEDGSE